MNKASPSFSTHRSTILAPLATEPGTAWEYGTSLDWAGQLVERLSGQSLDEYFKNNIFDPLGIKNISFFLSKAQNSGRGLSGMHQRAKDGSLRA